MVEKNRITQSTNDIFPITVKFKDSGGDFHLCQLFGVAGSSKSSVVLHLAGSSAGGIDARYCSLQADDVIEEIIAAKKEGRYADLTRLQPRP